MSLIISLAMFGAPALALPGAGPQRRVLPDLLQRVHAGEVLAHGRVARRARVLGQLDQVLGHVEPATAGATGADLADEVADALVELPGERAGERRSRRHRCHRCPTRPARPRASCS